MHVTGNYELTKEDTPKRRAVIPGMLFKTETARTTSTHAEAHQCLRRQNGKKTAIFVFFFAAPSVVVSFCKNTAASSSGLRKASAKKKEAEMGGRSEEKEREGRCSGNQSPVHFFFLREGLVGKIFASLRTAASICQHSERQKSIKRQSGKRAWRGLPSQRCRRCQCDVKAKRGAPPAFAPSRRIVHHSRAF